MDFKWLVLIIYQIYLFIHGYESARILAIYSAPFLSHQLVFRPLTFELAKRGHALVVTFPVTTFPVRTGNFTEIDIHEVSIIQTKQFLDSVSSSPVNLNTQKLNLLRLITILGLRQVLHPDVQKLLNSGDHFDLIIMETGLKINYIYAHIFKAPVILISSLTASMDDYELFGAPTHPFLYPPSMPKRIYDLNMMEKIVELYGYLLYKYAYINQEKEQDALIKKNFGEDTPSIEELKKYTAMLFLNVHRIWEGNRPVPPNIVYLGGLHQTPEKELPKDLKSYLDSSKNGVIYMSFGSAVRSSLFPSDKLKVFLKVFQSLPYDVLWKWEADSIPEMSDNVKFMKWVPQSDLLRHPKIRLFITQGGLQSTDEAITAGVPLVGIPMFGDQWYSAEKYVHHGIGVNLDFFALDEEVLRSAIEKILHDKSYHENIVKLRELMYDQPETSLERAVWWTEHVLRHGARHLRSPAANMPWTQYYEIELITYLLAGLVVVLGVSVFLVYFLFKLILRLFCDRQKLKRS